MRVGRRIGVVRESGLMETGVIWVGDGGGGEGRAVAMERRFMEKVGDLGRGVEVCLDV